MARIDAKELETISMTDPRWITFVQSRSEAAIFHHPVWAELLAEVYGYRSFALIQADGEGEAVAGLPLLEVRSWLTGQRCISLPFSDHCAPLANDPVNLTQLTTGLRLWWEAANKPRLEIRGAIFGETQLCQQQVAVLHQLDLSPHPRRLFASFSKMHQRNIDKAEKARVQVEIDTSLAGIEKFYQLHLITRRRLGVPIQPWRYFLLLWNNLIASGLGFVLLAYKDEQAIAGAVFLNWNNVLVYKYGASDLAYSSLRANNLLFWTAIQWACEHDCRQLDFGRTDFDNHGLRDFKSGWGAAQAPLTYSYFGGPSSSLANGLAKRVLTKIIRSFPPLACRIFGELLYGHFA